MFFDLPLDGQAVAIPARHIIRVLAHHLLGADHRVLEDLVEPRADMDVAVRIGRPIVEDELLAALSGFAQQLVQVHVLPALRSLGSSCGKPAFIPKPVFGRNSVFDQSRSALSAAAGDGFFGAAFAAGAS